MSESAHPNQRGDSLVDRKGPMIRENDTDGPLSIGHRKMLDMVMAGASHKEIQAATGYSRSYITTMVKGRSTPAVREAFRKRLEMEGLDLPYLVKKVAALTEATRPYFNKSTGEWDMFPDGATQLGAVRQLCKIFGLEDPDQKAGPGAVQVVINSNLESKVPPPEGHYEIEIAAVEETPAEPEPSS